MACLHATSVLPLRGSLVSELNILNCGKVSVAAEAIVQPILVQPIHQVRRQPVRALDAVAGRRLYLLRMQQTPAQVCSFLSVTAGSGWLGTPVSGHCQSGITHTPMAHSKLSAATGRTMVLT